MQRVDPRLHKAESEKQGAEPIPDMNDPKQVTAYKEGK
jgi:hypothetical protein